VCRLTLHDLEHSLWRAGGQRAACGDLRDGLLSVLILGLCCGLGIEARRHDEGYHNEKD